MDTQNKLLTAAAVSTFFILTVFVFAPSHAFLTNPVEFNIFYFELISSLALIAIPFFLLIPILAAFSPKKPVIHQRGVALVLSISFLLWLQGNILVWNYGLLRGSELNFNNIFLIIDAVVWAGVIIFVFIKSAFFYKHAKILSCTFIVIQLISTSVLIYKQPQTPSFKEYELDDANKFTFSKEKNVIILVLDAFQSELFQGIIDKDESYKDIFDGFVYFRNALAGFPSTHASVPNILTSQYYDNSIPLQEFIRSAYLSSGSILRVLKENGLQVDYFGPLWAIYFDSSIISNLRPRKGPENTSVALVFETALFRYLPDFLKKYIYNDGRWFLSEFMSYEQKISVAKNASDKLAKKPRITFDRKALRLSDVRFISDMTAYSNVVDGKYIFKYYHLLGAHRPFLMNENLEREVHTSRERQAKGALRIVKIFLDELRRLQAFDNSMIFVIADHGPTEALRTSATPLFLVKKFDGKGQMTISDAPVSLSDISKTIFLELGLEGQFNGESVFNLQESSFRERRFLYYKWWQTPGFDWTQEYMPSMDEYLVTGHVRSDDSWKATGRKFTAKGFDKFSRVWRPTFLEKDERNIIFVKPSDTLRKESDFFAGIGENWSFQEDTGRWTTSDTASIVIETNSENKQASLYLQYTPLKEDNALSIYLNGIKVKDCENNRNCSINCLTFKKGENIIELKTKLPATKPDDGDLRELCYNFQVVKFALPYFVLPTWTKGFFDLEGIPDQNWRWCSSEGILEINNTFSHERKIILDMSFAFANYSPEKSNLSIESDLFSEQLQANLDGTSFRKKITIPSGKHIIKFSCDAKRVDVPGDSRSIVFRVNNFKLMEKSGDSYYKTPSN